MTSLFYITFLLMGMSLAAPKWHQLSGYTFEQYIRDFSKNYAVGTVEYSRRQKIFYSTLEAIQAHNARKDVSWHMGVNRFTDMTRDETNRLNGARPRAMRLSKEEKKHARQYVRTGAQIPAAVDYRNSLPPILTAVKDQGNCGSCWAHGSTEQMETYGALATGKLSVLSQQQVTACAPNPNQCGGTGGCGGSTAELAFEYVAAAGGLTTEWFYPYTAHNGSTGQCRAGFPPSLELLGYTQLATNDQASVLEVLATVGPLAVNVDATLWFQYESGVFTDCTYNITINHVVQLVGYGTDATLNMDYWIVRNSWTPDYGENGYIRVHRSATPKCGWDVDPQDGTGCKGGPPQLWACGMCGILFDTSYPNVNTPN